MKTKAKTKVKKCGILSIWSTTQDMQRQGVVCVALGNFLINHGNGVGDIAASSVWGLCLRGKFFVSQEGKDEFDYLINGWIDR